MSELNVKLYFRVAFIALFLPYVSGDCVNLDLGIESGSIADNDITASSEQNANTAAKNGRLNSASSWCAETSDSNPYLQIDLQTLHIICAVSTQGNSQANQWVKTYKLKMSTDGSTWTDYKEGGQVKSFTGNEDRDSEVKHVFYEGVFARYLRLLTQTQQGAVCLRTELFGVKLKPENLALGKPTAQSSTFSDALIGNAASERAVDGNPDTNMNNKHCSQTTNTSNPSWWRVDLGSDYVPVSQIYIVNRFSPGDPTETSKDYEITLGRSTDVTVNLKCKGRYTFIKFKASAVCFTDPLTTGRYVGIMTTKSQALQLCEVEIYSRENLAYNKQTSQSSTLYGGASSRGVDGKSTTNWRDNSCTHTDMEDKAWWRIDLGKVEHVTEVYIVNRNKVGGRLSNFEIRVGTISVDGGVNNPKCGSTYSVPEGRGVSFFCHPSLSGRYVTVRSLRMNDVLTLCEVEVYSERRACPMQAIGLTSKDAFPDISFSASSSSSGNEASKGRLYGSCAWSPSNNDNANDYLQIDLLYEFVICAVATQGNPSADHWTKTYKLQLSYSSSNWAIYQENNVDKVFNGNSGRNDIVKHSLKEYASARLIRFWPVTYSGHKALRVEVFGVLVSRVPSQAPSGLSVATRTSTSIKASWQLPPEYARHGTITGFKLFFKKKDSVGSPFNITINDGGSYTKDITGLSIYTEYEFQVLAFTSKGDGPKSSVVVERTEEDSPTRAPSSLSLTAKTSTSIEASWQLPPAEDRNGVIRGFKLFYKKKGSSESITQITINSGSTLTKVVTGLDEYTEYEFEVLAFTSVGDGPKSSAKTKRTKEDAPPNIIEDNSPPSVICEKQTPCTLSCYATSVSPFYYSWTKNGQVPVSDDIRILNNIIVLTPRDAEDYGVYVCHVTNSFGSKAYNITVLEGHKSADTIKGGGDAQHILRVAVTPLSCIVFVLIVVIGVLMWRIRRAKPNNGATTTNKAISDDIGQPKSVRVQHVSDPGVYMELQPRPTDGQSRAPAEYLTLQGRHMTSGYYNGGFKAGSKKEEDEEVYDEVGSGQC